MIVCFVNFESMIVVWKGYRVNGVFFYCKVCNVDGYIVMIFVYQVDSGVFVQVNNGVYINVVVCCIVVWKYFVFYVCNFNWECQI